METPHRPLEIGRVLEAAESASPVEAVSAVARELAAAVGAVAVVFLITDASGRGLVRLTHEPPVGDDTRAAPHSGERHEGEESASQLPFDGGPAEQALRTQTVQ